jgi:hypothetical protein
MWQPIAVWLPKCPSSIGALQAAHGREEVRLVIDRVIVVGRDGVALGRLRKLRPQWRRRRMIPFPLLFVLGAQILWPSANRIILFLG